MKSADLLIAIAMRAVELKMSSETTQPEDLAQLREGVLELPQSDRDAVTHFLPSARIPNVAFQL
jgi:hypothetical protein